MKKGLSIPTLRTDWNNFDLDSKTHPSLQYKEQQELMAKFTQWLSTQNKPDFGVPGVAAAGPAQATEAPKAEAKKEEVKQVIKINKERDI